MFNIDRAGIIGRGMSVFVTLLGGIVLSAPGYAEDLAPGSVTVKATVLVECAIDSITDMRFGAVNAIATTIQSDLRASSTLSLTCSDGAQWTVHANEGEHSPDGIQRRVANPDETAFVSYNLTLDPAGSEPFPASAAEAENSSATGVSDGNQQSLTVYGRIPSGQAIPAAGLYTDQVVFTVTF